MAFFICTDMEFYSISSRAAANQKFKNIRKRGEFSEYEKESFDCSDPFGDDGIDFSVTGSIRKRIQSQGLKKTFTDSDYGNCT